MTLTATLHTDAPTPPSRDPAPFSWTEAAVAQLRRLWANGRSATQIAREIGGVSRSAVLSKAGRLGLRRPAPACEPQPISAVPRCATMVGEVPRAAKAQRARALARALLEQARDEMPAPHPAVAPGCRPCSFMELSRDTCRWPIGDPEEPGFHFCGAPPDGDHVYCAHHRRVAHAPEDMPEPG
jgi:GcrA cell cycle regulator